MSIAIMVETVYMPLPRNVSEADSSARSSDNTTPRRARISCEISLAMRSGYGLVRQPQERMNDETKRSSANETIKPQHVVTDTECPS